jgi:hypothetical protein
MTNYPTLRSCLDSPEKNAKNASPSFDKRTLVGEIIPLHHGDLFSSDLNRDWLRSGLINNKTLNS